ncbi:thioredoxin [Actinopolymorpha sp. B17G11]|uniref:thioredoxin n=1 Tax=unclassified Actinopolymorpha TaxID=2627063 RepID=UPI0032D8E845
MPADSHATIVACEHCGRRNRVPAVATGLPRCGNCRRPLPWIADADDETFDDAVEAAHVPVVVDLWASWCAPCRTVSPVLEQIAKDLAGRVKLVKIDVDQAPGVSERFTVRAVPMLLLMKGSKVIATQTGAAPATTLRRWVEDGLRKVPESAATGAGRRTH